MAKAKRGARKATTKRASVKVTSNGGTTKAASKRSRSGKKRIESYDHKNKQRADGPPVGNTNLDGDARGMEEKRREDEHRSKLLRIEVY